MKKRIQKRKRKYNRKLNNRFRFMAVALRGLILAGVSLTVYSKYYKTDNNKGMAIASGFYFSSSYMTELSSEDETIAETIRKIEDINDLAVEQEVIKLLSVKASDKVWTSNTYQFEIDINNYANQLLYNDSDLDISYNVEFKLLDEPSGATYHARKGNTGAFDDITTVDKSVPDEKVMFGGELKGGQISSDKYQVEVRLTDLETYKKNTARILVLAYPTDPPYLKKAKKIAGILTADYRAANAEITDQGFVVKDSLTENKWIEQVNAESALVYQIRTTGSYMEGSQGGQMQTIELTWDLDMYELNQYDEYRKDSQMEINEVDRKVTMTIKTNPYSLIKFVFFKKETFDEKVGGLTREEFLESVHAEMINGDRQVTGNEKEEKICEHSLSSNFSVRDIFK